MDAKSTTGWTLALRLHADRLTMVAAIAAALAVAAVLQAH